MSDLNGSWDIRLDFLRGEARHSAQLELAKILDAQRVALDGYKADAVRAKGG